MQAHFRQMERECALIEAGTSQLSQRDQLIVSNYRYAVRIASQYTGYGLELEDLIGFAYIGLTRAADRYQPDRGVSFIAYAGFWCRKEVIKALTDAGHPIRLPIRMRMLATRIRRLRETLPLHNGREATAYDIAEALGEEEWLIQTLMIATDPFDQLPSEEPDEEEESYD